MTRFLALLMLGIGSAAVAQSPDPTATVIAIPPLTSPDSGSRGNEMLALGWQVTQLIETDLRQTAEVMPLQPNRDDYYSYPEVTAPSFPKWRSAGAKALVTGFVQSRSDGRLTVGCYVYDTQKGRELGRKGFIVGANDWRRAAHKCSGLAYTAITGAPGMFDTQIAYVAESGVGDGRTRRIALMDSDGYNHRYLTAGGAMVLTPDIGPKVQQIAFVSYADGRPAVRIIDVASGNQRPVLNTEAMTFAPRFSPDGNRIAFSMMSGPNADIYVVGAQGGAAQRLTTAPGVDTSASFSPDGSQIVFESDRSGSQQLYVMNADGTGQRRISFGSGWYAAPQWSPDGKWISFTRRAQNGRSIGIIKPDGTGERALTNGPADEGASWAASSRELIFQRAGAGGRSGLARVALDGSQPRVMTIPQDGSDPAWSRVIDQ
ncbi:Tol-Pal system beta propeller repeat protein TolB [Sphingomonas flavescens]|uniref:Tol-Pal system beta propeller repeat protein TolB n=1 Tax=Sphingomonas flavescens TaxID=3132797 RepID=UPI0028061982|nr:Tol-Pal system beta propeller repeat protein TolB [Sphingomonas limnosediminicola]